MDFTQFGNMGCVHLWVVQYHAAVVTVATESGAILQPNALYGLSSNLTTAR